MQVFPFKANKYLANDIWRSYHHRNREMLDREYGSTGFVGDECAKKNAAQGFGIYCGYGHLKSYSTYEVDVEIISETEVKIHTYGMADAVYGGRGEHQDTFTAKLKPQALAEEIHKRKMKLAEREYERRLEEAAEAKRKREIQAVFDELFSEAVA